MSERRLSLPSAFALQPPAIVAFVGGGGKTSLMFALAQALSEQVVMTTTTRIFAAQIKQARAAIYADDLSGLDALLVEYGHCLVVGKVEGDKALGVSPSLPAELLERPDVAYVLVEADGSRMRPIKAPAAHEPVVPEETTLLVPVVGMDALESPIQDVAHRPELLRRLLSGDQRSAGASDFLTAEAVATLIAHPQGGLKNAPAQAHVIPFLNKVESAERLVTARRIAHLLLKKLRIDRVIIGAVKSDSPVKEVHKRVTAVVLAAGESRRMGQTKQLLPWADTTVLGQTIDNLKRSAVNDIVVVSGHRAEAVEAIASAAGVSYVRNPRYVSGEMISSLKTAVKQLESKAAAVLVMLADQPMVGPALVDRLLVAYWQGNGELIAPVYQGVRGNPVLIGRPHFKELLALPAGAAPRALLERHPIDLHLVAVDSDVILQDLDEREDYLRWRP